MQAEIVFLEKSVPPRTHTLTLSEGKDPGWLDAELVPEDGAALPLVVSKSELTRLLLAMLGRIENANGKRNLVFRLVFE